jgi:YHS domain-containing protein
MSSSRVIDPVCGMTISTLEAPYFREHSGSTWYLCSIECCMKIDADAEAYIAAARLDLPGWGQTPHPESVIEQFRRPEA